MSLESNYDAVVVGAGFAGLYMLHRLRQQGLTVRVFEAASDVGGTWFWNRYPGAQCDTESHQYSYSFSESLQQEWHWSHRYATQPEILNYLNHVADVFELRRNIQFNTRVTHAHFNEATSKWHVSTDKGESIVAQFCVLATGVLSVPFTPDIKGLDTFEGKWFHTGKWPHESVDVAAKRVAVIGTGSSGVNIIPVLAKQVKQLYVLQRTPVYTMPSQNRPLTPQEVKEMKDKYAEFRQQAKHTPSGTILPRGDKSALVADEEERNKAFEWGWKEGGFAFANVFTDLRTNMWANDTAAEFVREKIRSIVRDQDVANTLCPSHPILVKRPCFDTDYYETFNSAHVKLVDLSNTPIVEITPHGIRVSDNKEYDVDIIVYATGYDAFTGALNAIDIKGVEGKTLKEKWKAGPTTYLGMMSSGFPNLFIITGPGSPSSLGNMVVAIEQHVDWITDCISHIHKHNLTKIEPSAQAEEGWTEHTNEAALKTLLPHGNSWYMGANIPGKPRVCLPYVGGYGVYRKKCDEVAQQGYTGFQLT